MLPNRSSRPRVVDAREIAKNYREVFTQKAMQKEIELPFTWPSEMRFIGESLGVAYASDKWKKDGDYELYLHVAESKNRALCAPGFIPNTIGPMVSFAGMPMPKHFSVLGFFEDIRLNLHVGGTHEEPVLGRGDAGIYQIRAKHAMLGGCKIRWSLDGKRADEPFLVLYSEPTKADRGGVHMIIVGDELDIEGDGIVG